MKCNSVCFADGTLTIKRCNGWGTLSIPESQIFWENGRAQVEIPPSELRELCDFINKELAALAQDKQQ